MSDVEKSLQIDYASVKWEERQLLLLSDRGSGELNHELLECFFFLRLCSYLATACTYIFGKLSPQGHQACKKRHRGDQGAGTSSVAQPLNRAQAGTLTSIATTNKLKE